MNIKDQKLNALNEIMTAYETYRGERKSDLQKQIYDLRRNGKLSADDFKTLTAAFEDYKQFLLGVLSNSRRVHVRFDTAADNHGEDGKIYPFADFKDLDEIFKPIDI
ncbi:hypothetical protein FACS1894211_14210 [Clostridia bacterium]|nr:hypothetical protein FACS1894211_14210 [Clostridia bacterium]